MSVTLIKRTCILYQIQYRLVNRNCGKCALDLGVKLDVTSSYMDVITHLDVIREFACMCC